MGGPVCQRCGRALAPGAGFTLGGTRRCLRCTLRQWSLLRRSALIALMVGTFLVAVNQGPELLAGNAPAALLWKVPLTYLAPFCVATWGALSNGRS